MEEVADGPQLLGWIDIRDILQGLIKRERREGDFM
jgi:hypothetical protein